MGKGDFIKNPDRRVKLLLLTQAMWVCTLIVLILWWSTVISQKSDEIASLQAQLGVPESQIQSKLEKTERMILGESGSLLLLILVTNGILFFFFVRDHRRSKSLQAFFASVTHELRTPLTSIRLQTETLQDLLQETEAHSKHAPFMNRLLEDVERLEGEVQKTLELARIEGGGTLNLKPIQIRSFFTSKLLHYSNSLKIKIEPQIDDAFILADPTALSMIFRNIFDNAIKYSVSAPATISVIGKYISEQSYTVTIDHQNSNFQGNPQDLGKLFYRGHNSQGAGVGLYLIHTLMKKMNGNCNFNFSSPNFITHLQFKVDQHG